MNDSDLIKGAANIEQLSYTNGNDIVKKRKTIHNYLEEQGVDTGVKKGVTASAYVSPYAYKYIIRLDEKPVSEEDIKTLNPLLRATKGLYMIKYTPKGSGDYKKGRPFKIGQDLIRWDIRVAGQRHWHSLCKRVPELQWLEKNSCLTDEMFAIATRHPGMTFWFSVNWTFYVEKLDAQHKTRNPLVSRKVSAQEFAETYAEEKEKDNKSFLIRYFSDILKEVNDAEADPDVVEEMKKETGEVYDRSRKCLKDPVTGRFVKKNKEDNQS